MKSAIKKVIWFKRLLRGMYTTNSLKFIQLMVNNQNAIMLYKNRILHGHTNHITIKHHFIKEKVQKIEMQIYQISLLE
jgi:hypothetical protein